MGNCRNLDLLLPPTARIRPPSHRVWVAYISKQQTTAGVQPRMGPVEGVGDE
jgi:hypothetical protein